MNNVQNWLHFERYRLEVASSMPDSDLKLAIAQSVESSERSLREAISGKSAPSTPSTGWSHHRFSASEDEFSPN
jgi:hypothetical protein